MTAKLHFEDGIQDDEYNNMKILIVVVIERGCFTYDVKIELKISKVERMLLYRMFCMRSERKIRFRKFSL